MIDRFITEKKVPRGIISLNALMIALGVIMVALFIVNSVFTPYQPSSESTRFVENEIATFLCEAAVEEAVWHVRTEMNNSHADWYPRFRRKDLSPQLEEYEPHLVKTRLMEEIYGRTWPINVKIELFNLENFREANQQRVEKKGSLKITAVITLDDSSKKTLQVLKDIKVVNLGTPPPLDEFAVWIWSGDEEGVFPAHRFNVYQEDEERLYLMSDYSDTIRSIRSQWQWSWRGKVQYKNYYPFNREKISHYCRNWNEFKETFGKNGTDTFFLDGMCMIGDRRGIFLGGQIKTSGTIIAQQAKVVIGKLEIPEGVTFSLVSLTGDKIKINNPYYNKNAFGGSLYAPVGSIVNTMDTIINGVVYAGACYHTPRIDFKEKYRLPLYHVSMGQQVLVWREENE